MARRKKFSINDIIDAGFQVVRKSGLENLTARAIALELCSSTMPIYSCVSSMREVEEAIVKRAWRVLQSYQIKPRTDDVFIDMGLGYVLFSKDEKFLFQCIHDEKYGDINTRYSEANFVFNMQRMADYPLTKNLPPESLQKILFHGFLFSHGFASLLNSAMGSIVRMLDSEEAITNFFKQASAITWTGLSSIV
jgi:hypothetical protein